MENSNYSVDYLERIDFLELFEISALIEEKIRQKNEAMERQSNIKE